MRNLVTLITLVWILSLLGCRTDPSPSPGYGDPYPAPLNDPQITVLSPDLQRWLGFHPAIVLPSDGERSMRVEQPVRNMSDRQYLIEYRILFYDAHGFEMAQAMGWQMVPLDPKQTVRLTANARDTEAVSHRIEVRWAR